MEGQEEIVERKWVRKIVLHHVFQVRRACHENVHSNFFFLPALKHSTSGFDRKYPTNSVKKHASYLIYWRLGMSNCQILCKRTNINYILTSYISDSFSLPNFKSSIHRWCIQAKWNDKHFLFIKEQSVSWRQKWNSFSSFDCRHQLIC